MNPPWIPVTERLPLIPDNDDAYWPWNDSDTVVIVTTDKSQYTAYLRTDKDPKWSSEGPRWVLCGRDGYTLEMERVTAWLELPPLD